MESEAQRAQGTSPRETAIVGIFSKALTSKARAKRLPPEQELTLL